MFNISIKIKKGLSQNKACDGSFRFIEKKDELIEVTLLQKDRLF